MNGDYGSCFWFVVLEKERRVTISREMIDHRLVQAVAYRDCTLFVFAGLHVERKYKVYNDVVGLQEYGNRPVL